MAGSIVTINNLPALATLTAGYDLVAASSSTGTAYAITPSILSAGLEMTASGASAAGGTVPAPPGTSGTLHFLREDATWSVPPGSALAVSNGTTTNAAVSEIITSTGLSLASSGSTVTLSAASSGSNLVVEGSGGTLASGGTLVFSTGTTLSVSGTTATVTSSGGGGSFQAGPIVGAAAFTRPDVSAFTTLYSGSGSFTEVSGGPIVYQGPSPTGFNWSCLGQAISGATTLTALIEAHGLGDDVAGIYVADSSGKFIALSSNGSTLNVNAWDSGTSYGGTTYTEVVGVFLRAHWYRVVYDGTNLTWYYSSNGIAYTKLIEFTVASSILAGVATGGFANLAYENPTNDSVSYLWDFVI